MNVGDRVGMLFLPNDDKLAALAKQIVEDVVKAEGRCHIVGWRDVPVVKEVVGPLARATEPRIVQVQILHCFWAPHVAQLESCMCCNTMDDLDESG